MLRYWPGAAALAFILCVIVLPIRSSDDFAYCVSHDGQYQTQAQIGGAPAGTAINAKPSWVLGACLSSFTNENGVGITALATAMLMIVTGGLVGLDYLQLRTTRAQLRAYVFVDGMALSEGTLLTPPQPVHNNEPGVGLGFKNTGQTPASQVISWAQIDVIEPRHESTLVVPTLKKASPATLGPGGIMTKALWLGRVLSASEIADIGSGKRGIYFYGRIEYVDAFKRPQFTNFRMRYVGQFPPPTPGVSFSFCDDGNDAS